MKYEDIRRQVLTAIRQASAQVSSSLGGRPSTTAR